MALKKDVAYVQNLLAHMSVENGRSWQKPMSNFSKKKCHAVHDIVDHYSPQFLFLYYMRIVILKKKAVEWFPIVFFRVFLLLNLLHQMLQSPVYFALPNQLE